MIIKRKFKIMIIKIYSQNKNINGEKKKIKKMKIKKTK